jgi:DNA polymerase-1
MRIVTTITDDLKEIYNHSVWYVDTEGTSLDPRTNTLLLVQLLAGDTLYVFDMTQVDKRAFYQLFWRGWVSSRIIKVLQNAKYDIKVLFHQYWRQGDDPKKYLPQNVYDTLFTEKLLFAGLKIGFGLDDITLRRLKRQLDKSVRKTFTDFGGIFSQEQLEYAAQDVQVLPDIYKQQLKDLRDKKLVTVHKDEMRLVPVVALMEYTGMGVDRQYLQDLQPIFEQRIKHADKALQDLLLPHADEIVFTKDGYYCVNLSSPKQVLALFNEIGINLPNLNAKTVVKWDFDHRKTSKNFQIDFDQYFDEDGEIVEAFGSLENNYLRAYSYYVALNKLYSTYIIGLQEAIGADGRIHSNFDQLGTTTGRFASSKPNLQNIPQNNKLAALGIDKSIRAAFVCKHKTRLIVADYSGIELVIIADASGDETLMQHLDDPHIYVAQRVLNCLDITQENKKKEPYKYWRQGAKRVSYSIAYGVQGKSLAEQLTLDMSAINKKYSPRDGDNFIKLWKKTFPSAGKWLDKNAADVLVHCQIEDGVGRKRFWDRNYLAQNEWFRLAAQREASNFPVQSLSAHLTKLAMILTHESLDLTRGRIISCVHDEIILEATTGYAEQAARILKNCMETAARMVLTHLGEYVIVEPEIMERYEK